MARHTAKNRSEFFCFKDDCNPYNDHRSYGIYPAVSYTHLDVYKRQVPEIGKYGKLNAMAGMAPARKKQAMIEYEQEAYLAERIFGKTGSRR